MDIYDYLLNWKDQIEKAPQGLPTVALNSWMSHPQREHFYTMIKKNCVKLLFISPELFISYFIPFYLQNRTKIAINMICIDEAHSASLLSVDYRPSYSMISECMNIIIEEQAKNQIAKSDLNPFNLITEDQLNCLTNNLKIVPVVPRILLLTATANQAVISEISKEFNIESHFPPEKIFQRNFSLNFERVTNPNASLLNVMKTKFADKFPVLIFCSFKRSTETITTYLQQNGYKSYCFHGGLSELQKMNTLKELEKLNTPKENINSDGTKYFIITILYIITIYRY